MAFDSGACRASFNKRLRIEDHSQVCVACQSVSTKWWEIGVRLGLKKQTLTIIRAKNLALNFANAEACMSKVIKKWLKRDVRDGADRPSWRNLCLALSHIDYPLSEGISMEHGCKHINLTVSEVSHQSGASAVFAPQCCGCGQCTMKHWMTSHYSQPMLEPNMNQLIVDSQIFSKFPASEASHCFDIQKIVENFHIVAMETWTYLEELMDCGNFLFSDIVSELQSLLNHPLPLLTSVHELQSHFHAIHVSWFNYQPLQFLCQKFLSPSNPDLAYCWSNYCRIINEYCSSRSLKQFVDFFFKIEEENMLIIEIDDRSYDFTLADVDDLTNSLSNILNIPPRSLHLVTVRGGFLNIYFYYCFSDYLTIFKLLKSKELKKLANINDGYKILSFNDLHNHFQYNNIQKYKDSEDVSSTMKSGAQISSEKAALLLQNLRYARDYCLLLKKQLFRKDIELSRKVTDIKNKEEEIKWLKKRISLRDAKLSEMKLEIMKQAKSRDKQISSKDSELSELKQIKDELSKLKKELCFMVAKNGEALQIWKQLPLVENNNLFLLKEAISKETSAPVKIIGLQCGHYSIAVCDNGDILATEQETHCITVLDREGKRVRSLGHQLLVSPDGLAVTKDGYILVTDRHRLWKLTVDGTVIKCIGGSKKGINPLQFNNPCGIAVHPTTGQIFVAEEDNNRVQVLNADFTFSHVVTVELGHKPFHSPYDVSLDNEGYLYVADQCNHCIIKLTTTGQYVERISSKGSGPGHLNRPISVTVNNSLVYVSEWGNHRVSVFDTKGRFIHCFGESQQGECCMHPWGLTVDRYSNLYVVDSDNQRILVY